MTSMSERVVARYLEAAELAPDKLQALLLKVRKKAVSSFNWKNIADVITALGGKITKTVGLVPTDDWMYANSETEATTKHAGLEKFRVTSLPSNPKHGQLYITEQGTPKEEHGHWTWKAEGAFGNEGWLIEMPNGKTWTALPSQYDIGELRHGKVKPRPAAKISIYDTIAWLNKEGGWVELANDKLAMPALEPAIPRTRDNTGTCGVCFQNVKLKAGNPPRIVLHGYKRPGTGYVHGNCSGMGFPPFELSPEATKEHLEKGLKPSLKRAEEALRQLKAGDVTELEKHGRKYKVGDPGWEPELRGAIAEAERLVDFLEADVKIFGELVQHWKERPLPKEGDRQINWYSEGRKASWEGAAAEIVSDFVLALRVAAKYKDKKKTDKGNTVYMYSERQVANRNKKKAERIEKLRKSIGELRKKVKKDLKSSDPEKLLTALAVALIDHTYERVGNEESAKDGHFGVTGWTKKHISFSPKHALIKYVGKSGVKHEKKVTDAAIKKALRDAYEACEDDGDCLFSWDGGKVSAEKVNSYLEPFDVTAKDLRGFHANREMTERLKAIRAKGKDLPDDKKKREKILKAEFLKALDETSEAVGHEAATLRSQYLVPGLEESYMKDGSVSSKLSSALVLACGCEGNCGGQCGCGGGCSCSTYDRRPALDLL